MTLQQRITAFVQLGLFIKRHYSGQKLKNEIRFHEDLDKVIYSAYTYNGWFVQENVGMALRNISSMLEEDSLHKFCSKIANQKSNQTVAIIMAGNIPAVGFHDLMCVLLSEKNVLIKVSSDDPAIIPFLCGMLIYFEQNLAGKINFSDAKLSNFDAVIATGSNNTAKHFEFYFGKYPHIIRKNRTSVAVLNGNETFDDLKELGKDIFYYFGLGCRNVSKVFVPQNYNFNQLFEAVYDFKYVIDNKKYNNNYEYNRAIYLLDLIPFLDNNFLMIKESKDLHAPTSVLYFEYYNNQDEIVNKLKEQANNLQCIVSKFELKAQRTVKPGKTQEPEIFDFADDIDTIDFLNNI
jgi:hypothetical protein